MLTQILIFHVKNNVFVHQIDRLTKIISLQRSAIVGIEIYFIEKNLIDKTKTCNRLLKTY